MGKSSWGSATIRSGGGGAADLSSDGISNGSDFIAFIIAFINAFVNAFINAFSAGC